MVFGIESILICTVVGILITTAIMLFKRSKLKTVRMQRAACNYVRQGSFNVTKSDDRFLYSNITRIRRQQNNNRRRG